MSELNREQINDILDKMDFFQGQRAGRELWNEKPFDVQEQDIAIFSRDVALIKKYIKELTEDNQKQEDTIVALSAENVNLLIKIKELTEQNEKLIDECGNQSTLWKQHFDSLFHTAKETIIANTVWEMQKRFANLLVREFRDNTPEGADHYFKQGSLMMCSIADRVIAQVAKEIKEKNDG